MVNFQASNFKQYKRVYDIQLSIIVSCRFSLAKPNSGLKAFKNMKPCEYLEDVYNT